MGYTPRKAEGLRLGQRGKREESGEATLAAGAVQTASGTIETVDDGVHGQLCYFGKAIRH